MAEAWFGQTVDRNTAEHFARVLESVGLVRRDDHQRDRLCVLGVQESPLFPEEAELERSLKQANPKGRLLEWCAQQKMPAPRFLQDASTAGYRVRGRLSLGTGEALVTPWSDAPKLRLGEQAAAEAMLRQVPSEPFAVPLLGVTPQPLSQPIASPSDTGRNAAMALNELRQAGVLLAMGYEVVDQSGPSPQPTFSVVAWATTPGGATLRSEPIQAASKKSAQRLAADRLFDLLVAAGLSRR